MDERTNVIVFEKKEIFLIFIFLIAIAATSLAVGYRFGYREGIKKISLIENELKSDLSDGEVDILKSGDEEEADKILERKKLEKQKSSMSKNDDLSKLKQEFAALHSEKPVKKDKKAPPAKKKENDISISGPASTKVMDLSGEYLSDVSPENLRGKFTIQLGAYNDLEDAKLFATAFADKGYNPIINEVILERGVWYRVSLGVFQTAADAKNYISQQNDLFQGQRDFFITEIK